MRKLILATCLLTLLAGCDGGMSTSQANSQQPTTQQQNPPPPMAGSSGY